MLKGIGSEKFYRLVFFSAGIGFVPWLWNEAWRPTWYSPWFLALGVWASVGNFLLHALQFSLMFPRMLAEDPGDVKGMRSLSVLFMLLKGMAGGLLFYWAWLSASSAGVLQVLLGYLTHVFVFVGLMMIVRFRP
jgi:hypothetical protein